LSTKFTVGGAILPVLSPTKVRCDGGQTIDNMVFAVSWVGGTVLEFFWKKLSSVDDEEEEESDKLTISTNALVW